MNSVRQGFFWWEIDASYYVLRALEWLGVTWDLVHPPARVLAPGAAAREPRVRVQPSLVPPF